jgi:hypothetical protein
MGLRALKDRSWLDLDDHYQDDLAEKRKLLALHNKTVFAETPESRDAQRLVLELVQKELKRTSPDTDIPVDVDDAAGPLIRAALQVQEDLVLMQKRGDTYGLSAACVCFPTGWNLPEKVGKSMGEIHLPVPDLNNRIGDPIDRFFRNLKPGKIVERFNWGLYDSNALFQPGWWRDQRPKLQAITSENIGESVFFRVERQTLQRIGEGDDILFTIRIYTSTLSETAESPNRAARLSHALETMPPEMKVYKSIARYDRLIHEYLGQRCS